MSHINPCNCSQLTVICLICGNSVEPEQLEQGKAVCEICDVSVFGAAPIPRAMTLKEIEKQAMQEEEKLFLKFARRVFHRFRTGDKPKRWE